MTIDLHAKSQELLETLANSIHDRDRQKTNPFFFNIMDLYAAEKWLQNFEQEIKRTYMCA